MKIERLNHRPNGPSFEEPVFFSDGFRPFFLGAALFAGLAVPAWVMMLSGTEHSSPLFSARSWHIHEMVFGFLPAVMTGFLLTAVPNWTGRPPIHGGPLLLLFGLWLAGRLVMAVPWFTLAPALLIDGSFFVVVAVLVWRELALGGSWHQAPVAVVISLYAGANLFSHLEAMQGKDIDLPVRMALGLIMILLTVLGGRLVPNFTREFFLAGREEPRQPASFSSVDSLSIIFVIVAVTFWAWLPQSLLSGWLLMGAGVANGARMWRWYGWLTWREPLVMVLHWGYAWLALAMALLGGAVLGIGLPPEDAVHALTTGAIGVMTLGIMTRATLGHTGRHRHAGPGTLGIYLLVSFGAIIRVFGPATGLAMNLTLAVAATSWSGAYLLFAALYGPYLWRPNVES